MSSPETFRQWATGLQRASYQRRKSAGRTCASGCSFWPTPTFKSSGNTVTLLPSPAGLKLMKDERQSGKQMGLKNAVYSWTVLWELLMAMGWTPRSPVSSLPYRVRLRSGETGSLIGQTLNPQFSDWLMGWPPGWTEPLRPVTGWSRWLQHARGAC